MKNLALLTVLVGLGLTLSSGCASMQTRSVYERNAEDKMIVIQEKIGDGLKAGALTPDQSQMYLATLKDIRTDYAGMRDKSVSRDERNSLQGRLDALREVINRALGRTKKIGEPTDSFWERVGRDVGVLPRTEKIEEPTRGDRIIKLQRRIDDEISSGRMSLAKGSEFQARLDSVRSDYLRITEGARSATNEEKEEISRRLDSLETDLNHLPQL
ncbi:MAG TPA: hypothetical protein VHN12_03995 [Geobacteraceae bacterium]|nr:hypothetical protein [Geobacteraceae bacterium]